MSKKSFAVFGITSLLFVSLNAQAEEIIFKCRALVPYENSELWVDAKILKLNDDKTLEFHTSFVNPETGGRERHKIVPVNTEVQKDVTEAQLRSALNTEAIEQLGLNDEKIKSIRQITSFIAGESSDGVFPATAMVFEDIARKPVAAMVGMGWYSGACKSF